MWQRIGAAFSKVARVFSGAKARAPRRDVQQFVPHADTREPGRSTVQVG